jgi:hypothetical protein
MPFLELAGGKAILCVVAGLLLSTCPKEVYSLVGKRHIYFIGQEL